MELTARKEIAHEEHTYDDAFEMSEAVQPVNVRNQNNPSKGRANVMDTQHHYDDLHHPQSIGFKGNYTRWLKGAAVVLVVNTVVLIAVIIFLGIREGIATLQHRKEEMQSLGKSLSENLTEFRKEMQATLQNRKEEMQSLGESLSENLTEFRKEMQEIYRVPKIAFSATNPSSSTYSPNQVLILQDTSLNEGSGYNWATGEFTAPVAGLYLFSAHVCIPPPSAAHIAIVVGSKGVAHSVHFDQIGHVCSSVSTVTNVEKGEKVFLKATNTTKLYTDSLRQSSFIGVRISN